MFAPEYFNTRSQDLEEAYQDAGQFYWEDLEKDFTDVTFGKNSIPIILPRYLVQDIDTLEDWARAEYMYGTVFSDKFDKWNKIKQKVSKKEPIQFKQGEIYFMSVGENIGYEIYGHGELFLRPVLVYRKLSSTAFVGIPLTSKQREGNYYFTFKYTTKTLSTACINQIRTFDIRRNKYYDGYINVKDFTRLRDKVKEFMNITPNHNDGKGSGHVSKKRLPKKSSELYQNKIKMSRAKG
jgi:mRNA-degrading endonuclease toxin of MazEF toxin-antitoxin module